MRPDIHTRFVVVGSGAGGSVVAFHLARAGEQVVMLERGAWVRPEDMSHDELEMISTIYKDGGSQTNTEADMFLLQGQCVGGSTVLTNAVCFRMPEHVRRSFGKHGFELPAERMEEAYGRVESVMNVTTLDERVHNPATGVIANGMRKLGLTPGQFRKSMLHCIGCGYCNVGCMYGRKMDASTTWSPMARDRGCEILTRTEAVRIERQKGKDGQQHVKALVCRDLSDGSTFRIFAERFVLSGGAINTPELLLRNKIATDRVGYRTSFNCGAICFAEYEEPVWGFDGDQMCVHHFEEGFGIEQIHNPPASFALTMPGWYDRHHDNMGRYPYRTSAGVLVPTSNNGRVFLSLGHRLLKPLFNCADIDFKIREEDLEKFRRGFELLARVFLASGAKKVMPPFSDYVEIESEDQLPEIRNRIVDQKSLTGFGSSHPQGGACAGTDPGRDVVDPDFRLYGFDNLFVVDASVFPHSIEVNPMISIMAMADLAVEKIGGLTMPETIDEGPAWEARQAGKSLRQADAAEVRP